CLVARVESVDRAVELRVVRQRVLAAGEVRGIRGQMGPVQVPIQLQRGQIERIGARIRLPVAVAEDTGRDIRQLLPERGRVVQVQPLEVERGGDGEIVVHRPLQRQTQVGSILPVRVRLRDLPVHVVFAIHIAAVAPVVRAGSESQHAIDDRTAGGYASLIARIAVVCTGKLRTHVTAVGAQARVRCYESYGAAFGAGPEESSLRTSKHLDSLHVEKDREGSDTAEADVARLDRRVIEVHAGGGGAGTRLDTADRNIGVLIIVVRGGGQAVALEIHSWGEQRDIVDVAHALAVELLLAERADADWHILQAFGAPLRGHNNFLQLCGGRGGGGPIARGLRVQRH